MKAYNKNICDVCVTAATGPTVIVEDTLVKSSAGKLRSVISRVF